MSGAPRRLSRPGAALVVHPARHLPMDEARRTRAVASLTALLAARLQDRALGSHVLDDTGLTEVSSVSETSPAAGGAYGK